MVPAISTMAAAVDKRTRFIRTLHSHETGRRLRNERQAQMFAAGTLNLRCAEAVGALREATRMKICDGADRSGIRALSSRW
jgi:hypothetical protein